jgi:hypothetical protein
VANSGSPCPSLPLARAQAGIGDGGEKAWCSRDFVEVRLYGEAAGAPQARVPGGWSAVVEQLEIGANHVGMMNLAQRFVTLCGEETARLVVG